MKQKLKSASVWEWKCEGNRKETAREKEEGD
jgi:hypothetical protein